MYEETPQKIYQNYLGRWQSRLRILQLRSISPTDTHGPEGVTRTGKRHHLAAVSTYECACSLPKSWTDGDPLTHEGLFIRTFSCGLQHMTGCRVTEDSVK